MYGGSFAPDRSVWRQGIALLIAAGLLVMTDGGGVTAQAPKKSAFRLSSPVLQSDRGFGDAQVLNGFGCKGGNRSPELRWSGAPAGTRSYAVTLYDTDAPTGSGWWHWVVFNLPVTSTMLPEGAGDPAKHLLPEGAIQSSTDFGQPGYGGPCPPAGDKPHRYTFTVYALDVPKIDVPAGASGAMVGFNLHNHLLAKTTLTITHGR